MNNINEQLDILFDSWKKNKSRFICDGLISSAEDGKDKTANEQWNEQSIKVLFIGKEPYYRNDKDLKDSDYDGEDYRTRPFAFLYSQRFWNNILKWLYGVIYSKDKFYPEFSDIKEQHLLEMYNKVAFAYMNLKKEVGSSSTNMSKLRKYSIEHECYIKNQISILKPNVIFCCGTYDILLHTLYKNDFKQIDIDGYIHYNFKDGICLIANFHPNARISNDFLYTKAIEAYANNVNETVLNHRN